MLETFAQTRACLEAIYLKEHRRLFDEATTNKASGRFDSEQESDRLKDLNAAISESENLSKEINCKEEEVKELELMIMSRAALLSAFETELAPAQSRTHPTIPR